MLLILFAFLSICGYATNNSTSKRVLVINTYAETNPWATHIINAVSSSISCDKKKIGLFVEHINALMLDSINGVKEYKKNLYAQYANKKPQIVFLIGNGSWTFFRNDIKENWGDIPIILCSSSEYTSLFETSMATDDTSFSKNWIPLIETIEDFNITVIQCPVYVKETIDLIYQLKPKMQKLIFISDKKYVSKQYRTILKETIEKYYPFLNIQYLTEGDFNTDMLLDSIQANKEDVGVLYYSWIQKVAQPGNNYLTANTYKTIGSFSPTPVFTLEDIGVEDGFLAGGHFYKTSDLEKKISETLQAILNGKAAKDIPLQTPGKGYDILNYSILSSAGIPTSLYPNNTIYYHKPPSMLDKHKYTLLGGVIACLIYFLIMRISFFKKKQHIQKKELLFLSRYKNLIKNMPIAYVQEKILKNEHGEWIGHEIVDANPTFENAFEKKEHISGEKIYSNSNKKSHLGIYKSVICERKTKTYKYYDEPTDKYYDIMLFPTTEEDVIDLFCIDNTELRKAQHLLEITNHKLSLALEVANIVPWKWDLREKTIQYDADYHTKDKNSENTQQTIPEHKYFSCIYIEDMKKVKQAYLNLISGKVNKLKEEYRIINQNPSKNQYDWVEVQATVDTRNEKGKPVTLIGSSLVITERKKMEMDMRMAKERAEESNKLKSAFLANMSHEIRTPLNAIIGFSNILAITDDENEKKEYIKIIENNNTLLLQLIGDILDLSKIEAGTMDFIYNSFDLNALFEEIEQASLLKITSDIQLKFSEKMPQCHIYTDKHRLMQVVTNMINNAIKFTSKGYINFGYRLEGSKFLYFFVEDTGCGIPKNKLESVFGRFIKLNSFVQGTGLGLSICETIIHKMGGEIGVKSEEGKGSTFWFTLPHQPATLQKPQIEKTNILQKQAEKEKLTILIAEDNSSNYKLFETILKSDYKLIHAWNGQEAINLFNQHHPNLILMDINMPVIDGYEATKAIRKICSSTPIIAVTAYAFASDEEQIISSGFNEYIAKPIKPNVLKTKIEKTIQKYISLM